jgi:hypothetical protein
MPESIQLFNSPLTMIELFSGAGNIARSFKDQGYSTCSFDKRKRAGVCEPDTRIDIMKMHQAVIPFNHVNVVWASPPCTAFTYSAGKHYYDKRMYRDNALPSIKLLKKCLDLIEEINPDFFFIENPRGKMRYEKIMIDFLGKVTGTFKTVTLESYGFPTIKPTDIFTNCYDLPVRDQTAYGRGAKNKTMALFDMTKVKRQATPYELGKDIAIHVKQKLLSSYKEQITPLCS